ncbi:oxidoreductase [Roseivirga sp.]|uniref:oxidoreductase n=1 Tax=Roseivirga sp. TaxID=1964215 RepID=UPI003B52C810
MKQIIIITGASSGMGKDFALHLLKEGHTVYGLARRVDNMKAIEEAGGYTMALDITNHDQVESVVQQIIAQEQRIDVLINNAGFGMYGSIEDTTIEDARYQFEVNIFGLAKITQMVLPQMRVQKSGKIINISSMGGKMYTPLGAWYHATKHALEGWSDCLRLEVKSFGIDVVIIEPGAINTEFGDVLTEPMLKRSGEGPYAPLAHSIAKTTEEMYAKGGGSDVSVITNMVSKAIKSDQPKTRYVAGKFAKPMLFIRKYFSDRFFDKIIMSQVK